MGAPRYAFNAEIFSLLAVGLATVALRLHVRARAAGGLRGLASDDYLVVLEAAVYVTETILSYVAEGEANGLTNSFMDYGFAAATASQTAGQEAEQRVLGSKLQLGSWASQSVVICSLKAAVCVLYLRLANAQHRQRRPSALLGLALVTASWLGATLTLLLSCRPLTRMWQVSPAPGPYCRPALSPALIWTYTSLDVATYLYLMAVPLPSLVQTGVPVRYRLTTIALLACGFLAGLGAVNRAVVLSSFRDLLLSRKWEAREAFAALVAANMAIILPYWMEASGRHQGPGHSTQDRVPIQTRRAASQGSRRDGERSAIQIKCAVEGAARSQPRLEAKGGGDKGSQGVQRRIEVCVREDDVYLSKNGNYTGVWAGDQSGRQTRTKYFGDDIYQQTFLRV